MVFEVRMYHGYNNNTVYGTFPGYISVMVHYLVRMRVTSQITSRQLYRGGGDGDGDGIEKSYSSRCGRIVSSSFS
jgi:hypothetical protein